MNEDLGDVRDPALGARSLLVSCKPSGDGLGNGMDNQPTHYEVPAEGYRAESGARSARRSDEDTDPQASYRVPQYYRTPQRPPRDHQPPPPQPSPPRPYQMQQPYQAQQAYPSQQPHQAHAQQQPYQMQQSHQAPSQQQYQALAQRAYPSPPSPQTSRPFSLLSPGTQSVSPRTAGRLTDTQQTGSLTEQPVRPYWIRRPRTWPQRIGGILIAGACVVSAAWYVPRVINDDRQLLTGTVTSSGVIALNFTDSGQISKVDVRLNQLVRKGQVLAFEYDPNADTVLAADKETISAEQAKIAELRAAEAADPSAVPADSAQLAADKAELAVDEAQLATDRMKITATEIIAPADGTVVAANGQPGETVTSVGIRDYTTDSGRTSASQRPPFSLLPEGPQSVRTAAGGGSALPVIALRVSTSWQVIALVPEGSVSAVRPGMAVRISVPAVHIADMRGQVDEVLPTPVSTTQGIFYQAVVAITGHTASLPLSGMAADVQLGS
jgi:multidrug efflux pump subunit AcrA (membrane-fusion protein)